MKPSATTITPVNGKFEVRLEAKEKLIVFSRPTLQEALLALIVLDEKETQNG